MVVTADGVVGTDRRRPSRVRGDAARARGARSARAAGAVAGALSARRAPGPMLRRRGDARVRHARCARAAPGSTWPRPARVRARRSPSSGGFADAHAGMRLVVTADDARGSLGDATLDSAAVARARVALASHAASRDDRHRCEVAGRHAVRSRRASATPLRSACSATVTSVARWCSVLGALPADVRWIDARETRLSRATFRANVEIVATDDPMAEVARAPHGACARRDDAQPCARLRHRRSRAGTRRLASTSA